MDEYIVREMIHAMTRLEMRVIEIERKIAALEAGAGVGGAAAGGMTVADILCMSGGRLFWRGVAPEGDATPYCLSHFN